MHVLIIIVSLFFIIILLQGYMFGDAYSFNADISDWDVSNGTSFVSSLPCAMEFLNSNTCTYIIIVSLFFIIIIFQGWMFASATSFDADLSEWDVSSGTDFVSSLPCAMQFLIQTHVLI